jgi:hypothetical protein
VPLSDEFLALVGGDSANMLAHGEQEQEQRTLLVGPHGFGGTRRLVTRGERREAGATVTF